MITAHKVLFTLTQLLALSSSWDRARAMPVNMVDWKYISFFRWKYGDGTMSSPGDQVPGIGSGIAVELNVSAVGSLSSCTIQSPLQSSKGLRVSDWALRARGGYEIDAWFAPPAPSLIL